MRLLQFGGILPRPSTHFTQETTNSCNEGSTFNLDPSGERLDKCHDYRTTQALEVHLAEPVMNAGGEETKPYKPQYFGLLRDSNKDSHDQQTGFLFRFSVSCYKVFSVNMFFIFYFCYVSFIVPLDPRHLGIWLYSSTHKRRCRAMDGDCWIGPPNTYSWLGYI